MLVDEVKPEKAADSALTGIAESGEDVPRRCNRQKDQRARSQTHLKKVAQIPGEEKIQANYGNRKNETDEALRENVQGTSHREPPARESRWLWFVHGSQEECKAEDKPQPYENVRNQQPLEYVQAKRKASRESSVLSFFFNDTAPTEKVNCIEQR